MSNDGTNASRPLNGRALIRPDRVVIAGGGIAGIEALMALHDLGEQRLVLTLVAPDREFVMPPLSVGEPFGLADVPRRPLASLADHFGAHLVRDRVARVDPARQTLETRDGDMLEYDHLLIAVGASRHPVCPTALTFSGWDATEEVAALVRALRAGTATSVVFVVPPVASWPLPLYEIALMTARAAPNGNFVFVTHEAEPLALFGGEASATVAGLLEKAGIDFVANAEAVVAESGGTVFAPGRELRADAVVSLPQLSGPFLDGLPADRDGYICTDEYGRVHGVNDVFAAGDCTSQPIKQGGLAAQQADIAAIGIAQRAGAHVFANPFRTDLYAKLMTGDSEWFLERKGNGPSRAWDVMPAWPPGKVDGSYLAPWLSHEDALEAAAHA